MMDLRTHPQERYSKEVKSFSFVNDCPVFERIFDYCQVQFAPMCWGGACDADSECLPLNSRILGGLSVEL